MKYKILALLFGAPSILIGVFIMQQNQISKVIWMQNISAYFIFGIVSLFVMNRARTVYINKKIVILIGMVVLLGLTFMDEGMEGVHRWLLIGGVRLNIAMILLPSILILLWELLQENKKSYQYPILLSSLLSLVVIVILFCQPDASSVTGFAIPASIILICKLNNKSLKFVVAIVSFGAIVLAWMNLDHLPPIEYVEQIMVRLERKGSFWLIAGYLSLLLQLLPFFIVSDNQINFISKCIGIYFLLIILSTWFGNFPVPLIGYGVSPIMGYILSVTMLVNRKK